MLFMANITVNLPGEMDAAEKERLTEAEFARARVGDLHHAFVVVAHRAADRVPAPPHLEQFVRVADRAHQRLEVVAADFLATMRAATGAVSGGEPRRDPVQLGRGAAITCCSTRRGAR